MHPSPAPTAVTVAFRDHEFTAALFKGAPVFPGPDVEQALEYAPKFLAKQIPRWIDAELWQADVHSMVLDGDDFAAFKAAGGLRFADREPQNASMIRSATVLTERGLYRLLMIIGNRKIALDFQEMLETKVLPALMRTGSYSLPGADAAPRGIPTVREITGLLAELRRNKVPTTTIHGVTANLLGQIGIEFVPVASTPVPTAQLSLPLPAAVPAEPPPAPAPAPAPKPEPTPKRKSGRKSPPPARRLPLSDGDWPRLVRAWLAKYSPGPPKEDWLATAIVSASDLYALGIIELKDGPLDGRVMRFGKALYKRVDTVIDGYKIVHRNSTFRGYSLQKA